MFQSSFYFKNLCFEGGYPTEGKPFTLLFQDLRPGPCDESLEEERACSCEYDTRDRRQRLWDGGGLEEAVGWLVGWLVGCFFGGRLGLLLDQNKSTHWVDLFWSKSKQ